MNARILIPLIFGLTGCGITGPDKLTLHVQGTVTDAATGQAVFGAVVHLFPPTIIFGANDADIANTTTDVQGHYSISQSVDSKCLGTGFGFAVVADSPDRTLHSEAVSVECSAASQQIDLPVNPVTP